MKHHVSGWTLKHFSKRLMLLFFFRKFCSHFLEKLFKPIQTRHGVSQVYLESKIKKFFALACLGKKFKSTIRFVTFFYKVSLFDDF